MSAAKSFPPDSTDTYRCIQITSLHPTMSAGIDSLQLNTLPRSKELGSEDIRVRIHASALNFFDLLMLQGKYQYRPPLPFTVGSEASGIIIEIGSEVKKRKVGEAVIIGMTNGDAMASEAIIPESRCISKPSHFSHAEAAAFPVGFFTNWHALVQRGKIKTGETLLVTGAGGGMGLTAVQLGVRLGCRVIAAASSDDKCRRAAEAGAHLTINYGRGENEGKGMKEAVAAFTENKFADVIYDVVGGKIFNECIRCIAPQGRLLVIGFASGVIPQIPANMVLVKGFSVVGVRSGQEMVDHPEYTIEMMEEMEKLSLDRDRTLAPPVITVPLDRFRDAYRLILKREVIGKAVVLWQPEEKAKI